MAPDVLKGHLQLAIFQIGLLYALLKESRGSLESELANRAILSEIRTRLEETFSLTQEQKVLFNLYFLFIC